MTSDPDRRRRFVQEAKAASALNHSNIITIYDISSTGGMDFIAMEYVAGSTLEQAIGKGALPLQEAIGYAIQIADALAKAHAAGIIHRDLKPSNVMLTPEHPGSGRRHGRAGRQRIIRRDASSSIPSFRCRGSDVECQYQPRWTAIPDGRLR